MMNFKFSCLRVNGWAWSKQAQVVAKQLPRPYDVVFGYDYKKSTYEPVNHFWSLVRRDICFFSLRSGDLGRDTVSNNYAKNLLLLFLVNRVPLHWRHTTWVLNITSTHKILRKDMLPNCETMIRSLLSQSSHYTSMTCLF